MLLLVLTAVVLAGSLGLAWTQSQRLRELAPEQPIPGTPLIVRPPPHWISTNVEPNVFRLLREGRTLFGRAWRTERAVRYAYHRVRPRTDLLSAVARAEFGGETPTGAVQCKLAGLDALEFRLSRSVIGQGVIERALRAALSPNGELIVVDYRPMDRLSASDIVLLDDLCRAVRIDGARPRATDRSLR